MNTLGARLAHALASRGKTAAELARAVPTTESAVSQWLSGETKSMRGANLIAVCDVLSCNTRWLSSGVGLSGLDRQPDQPTPLVASHIKPYAPEVPADLMLLVRWINGITDAKLRDLVIQECTDVFLKQTRRALNQPSPADTPAQTAKKQHA